MTCQIFTSKAVSIKVSQSPVTSQGGAGNTSIHFSSFTASDLSKHSSDKTRTSICFFFLQKLIQFAFKSSLPPRYFTLHPYITAEACVGEDCCVDENPQPHPIACV